jgi:hypothetical protein
MSSSTRHPGNDNPTSFSAGVDPSALHSESNRSGRPPRPLAVSCPSAVRELLRPDSWRLRCDRR